MVQRYAFTFASCLARLRTASVCLFVCSWCGSTLWHLIYRLQASECTVGVSLARATFLFVIGQPFLSSRSGSYIPGSAGQTRVHLIISPPPFFAINLLCCVSTSAMSADLINDSRSANQHGGNGDILSYNSNINYIDQRSFPAPYIRCAFLAHSTCI